VIGQVTELVFRPDMKSLVKEEVKNLTGGYPVKAATAFSKDS
jgi:hypothetical protein